MIAGASWVITPDFLALAKLIEAGKANVAEHVAAPDLEFNNAPSNRSGPG